MPLEPGQWAAVAGVFAVIVAVIAYNALRARTAPLGRPSETEDADEETSVHPMMSRFAVHEGSVVGETVAVDGDLLILKQAGVFKAVPARLAELSGEEVALSGDIDWDEAVREGERWLERSRQGQDEAVSGSLTRSEDVKAPAREAFERRQREIGGAAAGAAGGVGAGAAVGDAQSGADKDDEPGRARDKDAEE